MGVDLSISIGSLQLQNPVLTASGTFGYGLEFRDFGDLSALGGVVVKGTTLKPRAGNRPQRIVETAAGMLNSIGLENPGVDYFLAHYLPQLRELGVTTIVNLAGNTIDEYCELAERLQQPGVAALELNISCPNVEAGGMAFGTSEEAVHQVVRQVRQYTQLPLIVKLSPNVTDIARIAMVAEEAGADAISLINTLLGMAVDIRTRRPLLGNIVGGLSGPAIKPVALRMVWQVAQAVKVPVIGMGGIMTATDAIEFLLCGASAVQIGAANFVEPTTAWRVIDGIAEYMEEQGFASVRELSGSLMI
ncbi:MAG TPA: dihydroorotate dehydrogenase [Firmicutes bacterium]|nr:dihydroorotate dehydrogenase [Bacillota bacterium]